MALSSSDLPVVQPARPFSLLPLLAPVALAAATRWAVTVALIGVAVSFVLGGPLLLIRCLAGHDIGWSTRIVGG